MTYNLAFLFRQSKLWRKLQPTDTFAVQLTDGYVRSCHVDGRNGEEVALVAGEDRLVFVEKAELSASELSAIKRSARTYKLKLKDDELYPRFTTADNWEEILEAVLFLSTQLSKANKAQLGFGKPKSIPLLEKDDGGFSVGSISAEELDNESPPEDEVRNGREPSEVPDRLIRKLRSFRRNRILQCDIIRLERTILSETGDMIQPAICFPVDKETRLCLSVWYFSEDPYDPDKMLLQLIDAMISNGYYPKKIEVRTEEVEALLHSFCQKANIQLRRIKTLPELEMEFERFSDKLQAKLQEEDTTCTVEQ